MSQELRNKIYGVVTSLFGLALILGIVDQATSDQATTVLNAVLDIAPEIVGVATTLLAFIKSLPSRVTVVDVPKASVQDIITPTGSVLAGPGNSLPDGTLLHAA